MARLPDEIDIKVNIDIDTSTLTDDVLDRLADLLWSRIRDRIVRQQRLGGF